MSPVFVGGIIRRIADLRRKQATEDIEARQTNAGVLMGSGLIAGEGLMGVLIAGFAFFVGTKPGGLPFVMHGTGGEIVSFAIFCLLGYYLFHVATRK